VRGYPRNWLTERPPGEVVDTRAAESRGFHISYDDAGSGPVIMLIPGSTMSAGDWRDAGYVDQLATSHRVLSIDPLGLGQSDKPHDPESYRLPDIATDVVAVMDAAGVDRATLWGYSYGGSLAAAMAVHHLDRVRALIFHDGLPEPVDHDVPSLRTQRMAEGDFSLLWDGPSFTFSEADRRYDEEFNDPRAIAALWMGEDRSGSSIDLARISVPALVLEARKADIDASTISTRIAGAEVHVLAGCDHLEAFSRLDLVMPLVNQFLESRDL